MKKKVVPPKPAEVASTGFLLTRLRRFKRDIFLAQPAKLYSAWMAEMRLPRFKSYFTNDPELVKTVLRDRPKDFPKSPFLTQSLASLLGKGVFISTGDTWESQRRIIDPSFEGGRLRQSFVSMKDAGKGALARLEAQNGTEIEFEQEASYIAADIVFRALFSIPISNSVAGNTFHQFKRYQQSQPLFTWAGLFGFHRFIPILQSSKTTSSAREIRQEIRNLCEERAEKIKQGNAPDDLATNILKNTDPKTGVSFSNEEMVDQVAVFFLAGHETSASALAWALYLLAIDPETQQAAYNEVSKLPKGVDFDFGDLSKLEAVRNIFRETLRLYPPVPTMIRETTKPETFRERAVKKGAQVVISPWHLHRHTRIWDRPDEFDPNRWKTEETKKTAKAAYIPFSAGPRSCPGAGFAMLEGVVLITMILHRFKIELGDRAAPVPVGHLTVRSKSGIYLKFIKR